MQLHTLPQHEAANTNCCSCVHHMQSRNKRTDSYAICATGATASKNMGKLYGLTGLNASAQGRGAGKVEQKVVPLAQGPCAGAWPLPHAERTKT
eukprot:scaffold22069_cov20-Tisochrysis_lutea.AAC.1